MLPDASHLRRRFALGEIGPDPLDRAGQHALDGQRGGLAEHAIGVGIGAFVHFSSPWVGSGVLASEGKKFSGASSFARVLLAQEPVENVEPRGPEALIEGEPLVRARERAGIEAADMGAPAHLALDQAGAFKNLDVLRGRRQRHGERLGKLADGALAGGEFEQHAPAGGVAQRVEDGGQLGRQQFNHVVECTLAISECQPYG